MGVFRGFKGGMQRCQKYIISNIGTRSVRPKSGDKGVPIKTSIKYKSRVIVRQAQALGYYTLTNLQGGQIA